MFDNCFLCETGLSPGFSIVRISHSFDPLFNDLGGIFHKLGRRIREFSPEANAVKCCFQCNFALEEYRQIYEEMEQRLEECRDDLVTKIVVRSASRPRALMYHRNTPNPSSTTLPSLLPRQASSTPRPIPALPSSTVTSAFSSHIQSPQPPHQNGNATNGLLNGANIDTDDFLKSEISEYPVYEEPNAIAENSFETDLSNNDNSIDTDSESDEESSGLNNTDRRKTEILISNSKLNLAIPGLDCSSDSEAEDPDFSPTSSARKRGPNIRSGKERKKLKNFCNLCNEKVEDNFKKKHIKTLKHRELFSQTEEYKNAKFACCGLTFILRNRYKRHLKTKSHLNLNNSILNINSEKEEETENDDDDDEEEDEAESANGEIDEGESEPKTKILKNTKGKTKADKNINKIKESSILIKKLSPKATLKPEVEKTGQSSKSSLSKSLPGQMERKETPKVLKKRKIEITKATSVPTPTKKTRTSYRKSGVLDTSTASSLNTQNDLDDPSKLWKIASEKMKNKIEKITKNKDRTANCSICKKQFSTFRLTKRHLIRSHYTTTSQKCPFCDKLFVNPFILLDHQKVHTSVTCEDCGLETSVTKIKVHQKRVHKK